MSVFVFDTYNAFTTDASNPEIQEGLGEPSSLLPFPSTCQHYSRTSSYFLMKMKVKW